MGLKFDLLVIVEANGDQLPPVLALLFPSKERVKAVESDYCPFGGIVQNGRKHRMFENRFAFVSPVKQFGCLMAMATAAAMASRLSLTNQYPPLLN